MQTQEPQMIGNSLNTNAVEAYIIGAVLNDSTLLDELMTTLPPAMFTNHLLRDLWQNMCEMRISGEPVDLASLVVKASDTVQRISVNKLVEMQNSFYGTPDWHVKKMQEMFIRREVSRGASRLAESAKDVSNVTVDELMIAYEQIGLTVEQTSNDGLHDGESYTDAWYNRIKKKHDDPMSSWGFVTGYVELDNMTLGWQRKDLIVVGGRTSIGKTAFAVENIIRMLNKNLKVAVFSLEMSEFDMKDRIASNVCDIPFKDVRLGKVSDKDLENLKKKKEFLSRMAITDKRGMATEEIISQMKRWKRTKGLDFVVVDYLQEIKEKREPNDNFGSALSRVVRKLRKAAMECNCAVMALSQLGRDAENKKPTLADFSGSTGIETAVDVSILLHRNREEEPNLMYVNLAKNRNGKTGEIQLNYDMSVQQIQNL